MWSRTLAVLAALLALSAGPARAQVPFSVAGTSLGPWQDLADCQLTSISSATSLSACTGGIPTNTQWALITIEGNAARWRGDGTAPTSSIGQPLGAGQVMYWTTNLVSSLQIIPQTGSITIDVSFFGRK